MTTAIAAAETAPTASDTPSNRRFLSTAPILSALVHLCVPMAAAMVISAVYNVINAGFIGAMHDPALLAAVTFGTPLLGLIMGIGGLFGVGGGALAARLLGAAERSASSAAQMEEIKRVSAFAFWGAAITGAMFGGVGLLFLHPLVALLGATPASTPATSAFVGVTLASVPVLAAAFCLEQLVRAEGAARQAMTGLVLSTVVSLLLDALFILALRWGVAGAALSTAIASLVSIAYWAMWLQRNSQTASLSLARFRLERGVMRDVFGVGAGELMQSGFLIVTTLVLNNLAAQYGDGPLAAMGIAVRIAQVPEFLIMGVTLGIMPLLAYSYGKGDAMRWRNALRAASAVIAIISFGFFGLLALFRHQVVAAFVHDPAVVSVGVTILLAQLTAMVANGFTGLMTSAFQAAGRAVPAIVMSLAQGVLFIPVVLVGNAWFGLGGIIWALTVTEIAVFLTGGALWLASRRAVRNGLALGSLERAEEALAAAEAH